MERKALLTEIPLLSLRIERLPITTALIRNNDGHRMLPSQVPLDFCGRPILDTPHAP
jgi:hypothetical protein